MRISNRLARFLAAACVSLALAGLAEARNRKGDRFLAQGRQAEQNKDYDKALELFEQALSQDPSDVGYQMAAKRVRFQAGQAHVDRGQKLRQEGKLEEALAELEKAYAIDPSSRIAEIELRRLLSLLEEEKKKTAETGKRPEGPDRGLTPAQAADRDWQERMATAQGAPVLRPISRTPITLKMSNHPRILFETVGKLAGINVLFDPDYQTQVQTKTLNLELTNSSLEEALDYLAVLSRSYWKPMSANAIFVTVDNPTKRRDFEDNVVKVIYLTNVATAQELTELSSAVRGMTEARRLFTYNAQNAIIVRGTVDQVALIEKLIKDLDKPKAEVVVDVIVMEANRTGSRDLAATIASGGTSGISTPIGFTPRNPVLTGGTGGTDGTGGTGTAATTSSLISLARIGKVSTNDFSLTLPGALLEALMTDRNTKVLQSPQVRAADGQKASLRIGDKVPTASGGFQPAFGGGAGFNSLFSQFQFIDVGVNVDITPKIHGSDEVSLHVELEISNVRDRIDLGGISQPVIGQRRIVHDIRIREGEVNLLGGLMKQQETRSISGVPGLASIPIVRRLFTSESVEREDNELLIALIPHIVRTPDYSDVNFRGLAVGTEQVTRLTYRGAPPPAAQPAAAPKAEGQSASQPAPEAPVLAPASPAPETPAAPVEKPASATPAPAATPPPPAAAPPEGTPAPSPAAGPTVQFTPARIEAQPGMSIMVNLDAANVTDLFSAPLRIKFDPAILRLTEVTRGNLLANDGKPVLFTRNIQNEAGEAVITLLREPKSGGVSGSGTLVTLTFEVVGRGTTTVAAPQVVLRNPQSMPILTAAPGLNVTVK